MAAQDPVATTRCFHYTVRIVLKTLFNCTAPGELHADGVPSGETPGIHGHVAGYLGVVEPQMRKALHIHMLVQLLGFADPEDIFSQDQFEDVFRRVWCFVASICFRSTEGFARYLGEPAAMETLQQQILLPLSKKQRDMIGPARVQDSIDAQLRARRQDALPAAPEALQAMRFFVPEAYADGRVLSPDWCRQATREIFHGTRKTGNHVCRAEVCHKGRVGKMGFCRMFFWHWRRGVGQDGKTKAKRVHGLPLQEAWDGRGSPPVHDAPPFLGLPGLEVRSVVSSAIHATFQEFLISTIWLCITFVDHPKTNAAR